MVAKRYSVPGTALDVLRLVMLFGPQNLSIVHSRGYLLGNCLTPSRIERQTGGLALAWRCRERSEAATATAKPALDLSIGHNPP